MAELKSIPIGVEDFKRFIDDDYYFIDKTLMIKDMLDKKDMVRLFTRPRRFGKTLNMSMIQRYFEKTDEDNSYLFKNLNISSCGDKYLKHMGQYPVITLSLKSMKQASYEDSFYEYRKIIANEFSRHHDILNSVELDSKISEKFEDFCYNRAENLDYLISIKFLSDCLRSAYNKNVIILIDECDVPFKSSCSGDFYDKMVSFIGSNFESALKTNSSLEFAVLTGCLKISNGCVITGLNNLNIYSIQNTRFSEYFGFTESEVRSVTEYFGIEDKFNEIKEWYDGYAFGKTEIYNTWSILKYISDVYDNRNASPKSYWNEAGSDDIIRGIIEKSDFGIMDDIQTLLNGGLIKKRICEEITYCDIQNISSIDDTVWSFLLFTGYLKQISVELNGSSIYSEMIIPNVEISTVYKDSIMNWFDDIVNAEPRNDIFNAMITGNAEKFEEHLKKWLKRVISYHDRYETFYHGFTAGLISGFADYKVKSNRESGDGRSDIIISEISEHSTAVIIEIKSAPRFAELEKKCFEALDQIDEKEYERELIEDCYHKIIKYGIAFCDSTCKVRMR